MRKKWFTVSSEASTRCPNYMRKLPLDRMLKTKRPPPSVQHARNFACRSGRGKSAPLEALAPTQNHPPLIATLLVPVVSKDSAQGGNSIKLKNCPNNGPKLGAPKAIFKVYWIVTRSPCVPPCSGAAKTAQFTGNQGAIFCMSEYLSFS